MSGGLDSTTVYGMAQSLIRAQQIKVSSLETFSTVFPGEDCDETNYIKLVNDFWEGNSNLVERWIAPPEYYIDHAKFYQDCPDSPNGAMNTPLKERVKLKDIRVLLTGCGGDEWFWGRNGLYADLIRTFQFRELINLFLADEGNPWRKAKIFLRYGLWPLLPVREQNLLRRLAGRRRRVFDWITPDLLRDSCLEDRITAPSFKDIAFASLDQEEVYRLGTNAWMASNAEIEDLTSMRFGIEQRHPLWDRRIIEYALALPGSLRWCPPHHKYILRQAASGLLPEKIRWRQDKTLFNSVFPKALEMQGGVKRMGSLALADRGWINAEKVVQMTSLLLSSYRSGEQNRWGAYIWPTWMVYSMDVWHKESAPL